MYVEYAQAYETPSVYDVDTIYREVFIVLSSATKDFLD